VGSEGGDGRRQGRCRDDRCLADRDGGRRHGRVTAPERGDRLRSRQGIRGFELLFDSARRDGCWVEPEVRVPLGPYRISMTILPRWWSCRDGRPIRGASGPWSRRRT
jgi:hypothetical protein